MSAILAGPPMIKWGFYTLYGTGHRLLKTEMAEDLDSFWETSIPVAGVEMEGHQLIFQPGSWRFRISNLMVLGSGVVSLRVQEGPVFTDSPLASAEGGSGKSTNLTGSMVIVTNQAEARVSLVYEGMDANEFVILYPGGIYLEKLA